MFAAPVLLKSGHADVPSDSGSFRFPPMSRAVPPARLNFLPPPSPLEMTSAHALMLACAAGFPVVAWSFRRVLGHHHSRRVTAGGSDAPGMAIAHGEPDGAGKRATLLLLPGVSAEAAGQDEVAIYLHNGHDRSVCFSPQADELVVTLKAAEGTEVKCIKVVDAFFSQAGPGQAWLEAGATAGPYRMKRVGLQRAEIAYRHVAAHSTVETSRRVVDL